MSSGRSLLQDTAGAYWPFVAVASHGRKNGSPPHSFQTWQASDHASSLACDTSSITEVTSSKGHLQGTSREERGLPKTFDRVFACESLEHSRNYQAQEEVQVASMQRRLLQKV